jgi:hypothetical protein
VRPWAPRRNPLTCPCTSPAIASRSGGFSWARAADLTLSVYEEALASLDTAFRRAPFFGHIQLYRAAALAHLGRPPEAQAVLSVPTLYASIGDIRRFDSYVESVEFDRFIEGLRKAGLPE